MSLFLLLLSSTALLHLSLAVKCRFCDTENCDTGICEGDFCFFGSLPHHAREPAKGCLSGTVEAKRINRCSIVYRGAQQVPQLCICDQPNCNSEAGIAQLLQSPMGTAHPIPQYECKCEGPLCMGRSHCNGERCWFSSISDEDGKEVVIKGCMRQTMGLPPGKFCVRPPVINSLHYVSLIALENEVICFCHGDGCNKHATTPNMKKAGGPQGWIESWYELNGLVFGGKGDIWLSADVKVPSDYDQTFVEAPGFKTNISISIKDKNFIIKPEDTVPSPSGLTQSDEIDDEESIIGPDMPPPPPVEAPEENTAVVAVFVVLMIIIAIAGLGWKFQLHRKIFASRYQTVS